MNQSNNNWLSKFMSPSRIDSYIYHRDTEDNTVDMYIENLLNLKPSIRMEAGTAFHAYIEKCGFNELPNTFTSNGWTIYYDDTLEANIKYPRIREQKIVNYYWRGIQLRSKIDAIDCLAIHDLKTTSKINIEKYMESYQWKLYLLMTNYNQFIYNIFEINIEEEVKHVYLKKYEELKLFRYEKMEQDIDSILTEYRDYLIWLKPKIIEKAKEHNKTYYME